MHNNKLANQLKMLQESLLDAAKDVGDLQHGLRSVKKEKSDDVSSIVDGVKRDVLIIKDNIHRVRRKIFN